MTQTVAKQPVPHAPSGVERAVGILFAFLVLALVAALTILEIEVQAGMQKLLNVLLALMAAAVAATVPGFVNVSYSTGGVALRAAGGAAVMLCVMYFLAEQPVAAAAVEPGRAVRVQADPEALTLPEASPQVRRVATQTLWRAESWCPMTGASGWATSPFGPQDAQARAVQACVVYGGVPDCCARNVALTD